MWKFSFVLIVALFVVWTREVKPIKCLIGWGQRGLEYSNEITWKRDCPATDYCFEAVTTKVDQMKHLINYPWNSYYSQFFIRSCGGDMGTSRVYRPYRGKPRSVRALGIVKINITTESVITGEGGTEELFLKHACRKDYCVKGTPASAANRLQVRSPQMLLLTTLTATALFVLSW